MIELYKDYNNLCQTIEWLEAQIEVSQAEQKRWGLGDLGNSHKYMTGLMNMDRLEKNIAQYEEQLEQCRKQKRRIDECISRLKGTAHDIAKLRYIEGKTLKEIAVDLNMSYDRVRHIHADILKDSTMTTQTV